MPGAVRVMDHRKSRRAVLKLMAPATAAAFSARPPPQRRAMHRRSRARLYAVGGGPLRQLSDGLPRSPRRRGFKALPMVLTQLEQWDSAGLDALLATRRQALFDTTTIAMVGSTRSATR